MTSKSDSDDKLIKVSKAAARDQDFAAVDWGRGCSREEALSSRIGEPHDEAAQLLAEHLKAYPDDPFVFSRIDRKEPLTALRLFCSAAPLAPLVSHIVNPNSDTIPDGYTPDGLRKRTGQRDHRERAMMEDLEKRKRSNEHAERIVKSGKHFNETVEYGKTIWKQAKGLQELTVLPPPTTPYFTHVARVPMDSAGWALATSLITIASVGVLKRWSARMGR